MNSKQERDRRHDAKRRTEKLWRDLYKTARWQTLRAHQLSVQPLCARCQSEGRIIAATVVHHKRKHNGDPLLFFDINNLASSCAPCHDAVEQGIEKRGYDTNVDAQGNPTDPRHPFYR